MCNMQSNLMSDIFFFSIHSFKEHDRRSNNQRLIDLFSAQNGKRLPLLAYWRHGLQSSARVLWAIGPTLTLPDLLLGVPLKKKKKKKKIKNKNSSSLLSPIILLVFIFKTVQATWFHIPYLFPLLVNVIPRVFHHRFFLYFFLFLGKKGRIKNFVQPK